MLRKIKVYGRLRKFLGQAEFEADAKNVIEVISFLRCNFKGIERHMMNQEYKIADNLLGIRITFEQFEDKLKSEDKKKLFSLLDQYQPQADFNFEVENVQDFIQFCKMSGGFCIA